MAWYLSSRTCIKLNTGKSFLAAFWLSPGLTAQYFWLSLQHHEKCHKLTISGLCLWQFKQLLWLGLFCTKFPVMYIAKCKKNYITLLCFSLTVITYFSSVVTICIVAHRHTTFRLGHFLCLVLCRYWKRKTLPCQLVTANTNETRFLWDTATFQKETFPPLTHAGKGHSKLQMNWLTCLMFDLAKF